MTGPATPTRDTYYANAQSWAEDRGDALRASRRIAWIVAGAAALIAVCEALALLFLLPLKTVVPYTLLVDRQTGFVQALKPLEAQRISGDAALTQSFLVQYVIAREGYDADSVQSDYRKVALWSAGQARTDYIAGIQPSNPASPIARLPRSTIVEVRIKSVTAVARNVSMVRYQTVRHDAGGQDARPRDWVSVIRYGYTGAPLSVDDRLVNPLGFKVQRYRTSAETLTPPDPAPAAMATPVVIDGGAAVPQAAASPAAAPVPARRAPANPLAGYPRVLPTPAPYL